MAITATKTERVDLRISKEDKELLDRASQISGLSISSYILMTTIKQARLDLIQNERLVLSNCERDIFIKALESPAEPNEALKELFH